MLGFVLRLRKSESTVKCRVILCCFRMRLTLPPGKTWGILTFLWLAALALPAEADSGDAEWYDPAWSHRQKLVVDHEFVAEAVSSFPLLVRITNGPIFDTARENGFDILFTTADGSTKLKHELEAFNQELIAWVEMPALSNEIDTIFYIYYGNPEAENQQQPASTWHDTFVGVWHFNQDPVTVQQDSTSNNKDGTGSGIDTGDQRISGKIGRAVQFDGSNDRILIPDTTNWAAADFTVSFWVYVTSYVDFSRLIYVDDQFLIAYGDSSNRLSFNIEPRNVDGRASTQDVLSTNTWKHVDFVFDSDTLAGTFYIDAVAESMSLNNPATMGWTNSGSTDSYIILMARDNANYQSGLMDELRLSNVARSGGWIKTAYNNQSGTEAFLHITGAETYSAAAAAAADEESSAATPALSISPGSSTAVPSLTSGLITAVNRLYRMVHAVTPSFNEWQYWANRVVGGEKTTEPAVLGAMQWQRLLGGGTTGQVAGISSTGPTIEIRNGTNRQGLARRTRARLQQAGYTVTGAANANDFLTEVTGVFVLNGRELETAASLGQHLGTPVTSGRPARERATVADVLVLLGKDFKE